MRRSVLLLLLCCASALTSMKVQACSCTGPDQFIQSIGNLIIEVEVIGIVRLDTFKNGYTATQLKVHRVLKGQYESDTLYVLNDKGFECFHTVPNKKKGTKYILTGGLYNQWSMPSYKGDSLKSQMMELDLCLENFVYLEGNKVRGNITKNKANKVNFLHKIYYRIDKNGYGNWAAKRQKSPRHEQLMQVMSMRRFERLISKVDKA